VRAGEIRQHNPPNSTQTPYLTVVVWPQPVRPAGFQVAAVQTQLRDPMILTVTKTRRYHEPDFGYEFGLAWKEPFRLTRNILGTELKAKVCSEMNKKQEEKY